MHFNWELDKQTMYHHEMEHYSAIKKKTIDTHNNIDESQMHYNEVNEAQLKGSIVYASVYIIL